jgi:hypothetical protein
MQTMSMPYGGQQMGRNPFDMNGFHSAMVDWRGLRPDHPMFDPSMGRDALMQQRDDWRSTMDAWRGQRPDIHSFMGGGVPPMTPPMAPPAQIAPVPPVPAPGGPTGQFPVAPGQMPPVGLPGQIPGLHGGSGMTPPGYAHPGFQMAPVVSQQPITQVPPMGVQSGFFRKGR